MDLHLSRVASPPAPPGKNTMIFLFGQKSHQSAITLELGEFSTNHKITRSLIGQSFLPKKRLLVPNFQI
jgi:hypothetical protein